MRIALVAENSSEYGRRLIDGVAAFAREERVWRLTWLRIEELRKPQPLKGFSGVIARVANDAIARPLKAARIPVVDVFCQKAYPAFYGVNSDHETIGRLAAEHFLAKRHRHFAFAGFKGVAFSEARRAAFIHALPDRQVACWAAPLLRDQQTFFNDRTGAVVDARGMDAWLRSLSSPTALFAANDLLALQIMERAEQLGINVPEELAVLGVDDDRLLCAFASTPISSIEPNAYGIGYTAARILAKALRDPSAADLPHSILHVAPNGLVERASSERHAVHPEWLADALGFIDASIARPISTADILALTGHSHATVRKTFIRVLGESAQRYILRVKMNAAKKLLESDGNLLVKEVAERTGFASTAYFCTVYRAFWGTSPRAE